MNPLIFSIILLCLACHGIAQGNETDILDDPTNSTTTTTTTESPMDGEPEVVCAPDAIFIGFYAPIPFEGVVFMAGESFEAEHNCVQVTNQINHVSILVPIQDCRLRRTRVTSPIAGVNVTGHVILSFHPEAVRTALDRVIQLGCFFESAHKTKLPEKPVDQLQIINYAPPNRFNPQVKCFYQILDAYNLSVVSTSTIGAAVMHRWVCVHSGISPQTHCIHPRTCYMHSPHTNTKYELIDHRGCVADPRLIQTNIRHDRSQLLAQLTTNVFAFFNQPELRFSCELSIEHKLSGTCDRDLRCADDEQGQLQGYSNHSEQSVYSKMVYSPVMHINDNQLLISEDDDGYNRNYDLQMERADQGIVCMSSESYVFVLVMSALVTALAPIIGCGVFCVYKKLYS